MTGEGFKRKLTTILSADVAEYSRLMGEDETATVKTLTSYRQVMTELIKQHRGRVIDSPGDNLLAEFTSVVDAVQCSLAVQKELQARNAGLPENRRMQFRIGINLGDVIEEEDRIYGDGVNIAARLEALAEPGGICISKTAFDQIETKLPLGYKYLGEQEVKNITKPVGAYQVLMEPRVTITEEIKREKAPPIWRRKTILAGGVAFIVLVIAALIWNFYFRPPPMEPASIEKMAFPLPDKPSIAVLPFTNMSDDPKQEYFADGITEDLITDLSQMSGLFVIARNSTFVYKGKPVKIRQVAEELGVRYVLEGSVRRAGEQVRINTQLIDATTGHHLWAKRYDGELGNIFALQDKITQKIVSALAVKLIADKQEHITGKETENFEAYDAFLKGWEHYLRTTEKDYFKAVSYFERAIELDPNYGRAYAALALTYWNAANRFGDIKAITSRRARLRARKNLQMAMRKPTSIAYQAASEIDLIMRRWQEAIANAKEAIDLDSNNAGGHLVMGRALIFCGKPAEGVEYIKRAMRLDPHYPALPWAFLGFAYFCMGQYEEAATLLERSSKNNPELLSEKGAEVSLIAPILAAAYGYLGRNKDAQAILDNYVDFILRKRSVQKTMMIQPFMYSKDAARLAEGLIKANMVKPHVYYKLFNENQLRGKEIKALVFGREVAGSAGIIIRNMDGEATFQGTTSDSGKSWIEGDILCDQWQNHFGGQKFCYPVFRNPDGSRTKLDEYIYYGDLDSTIVYSFSPLD